MTEDQINHAISEYYIGNKDLARQILMDVVENDPANEDAWLLLSNYSETTEQKEIALKRLLLINPNHPSALDALSESTVNNLRDSARMSRFQAFAPVKTGYFPAQIENPAANPSLGAFPVANAGQAGVRSQKSRLPENRWYRIGVGFLGSVILLWGVFIGLLIKGQNPGLIPVTGNMPALIENTPTVTPAMTQTSPANDPSTKIPAGNPAALLETEFTPTMTFTSTAIPTLTLTPSSTRQPTASKTPTITTTFTATFRPTLTKQPSRTTIPTSTSNPSSTVSPTFQNLGGTQADPVKAGNAYRFLGIGTMKVESSTWQAGQTGLTVLKLLFSCELPAEEICATELFTFELVSSSSGAYPRDNDSSIPKPWFGSIINFPTYGGSGEQGYLGFLVSSPESSLLLRVRNSLDAGSEVYFELP